MPNSPSSAARHDAVALTDRTEVRPVYVIGGGPGGLATAAALRARGVRAVVLEKSDRVGASWRGHYDRLHLHTTRRWSALPGLKMPRRFGRWVGRDDVVRYLEKYTEHHELEVVTGVEVTRESTRPPTAPATGSSPRRAAGSCGAARSSSPPASTTPRGYRTGRAATRSRASCCTRRRTGTRPRTRRSDVLVVGIGNTGAEIAADLAEGGASAVRIAVRTAPHIVRRSTAGWPAQATGILVRRLPVRLVDRAGAVMSRIAVPDLTDRGLPRPATGLYSRVREGAIPVQDVGLVDAVKNGRVTPVATVASFDKDTVVLADGTGSPRTPSSPPPATTAPWSHCSATWTSWTGRAAR